jgi:5-methyltetrahydrofolate--homocysteine methyltransferase
MKSIIEACSRGIVPADGAMGSELMKHGLEPGDSPELWNADRPEVLQEIHASYISAGARMILTNTFGGNPIKLGSAGLEDRLEQLNRLGVENAAASAGDEVFIAGDMGPTGQFLEPVGTFTEDDFIEAYAKQAEILAGAGADLILIETMADLGEMSAAYRGAERACGLPIGVSLTFEKGTDGQYRTMMGVTVEQYIETAEELGADIVGTNCGRGGHETAEVAAAIRKSTDRYVLAFPNAGVPHVKNGATVYDQTPEIMREYYQSMIDAGVNIIGGCCGTAPEHIAVLSGLLH